jgi:PAS domain S-box-containing protein
MVGFSDAPEKDSENAVLTLSQDFGLMSCNPMARALIGNDPRPGQRYPLEGFFPPRDLVKAQTVVREVFRSGRPSQKIQGVVRQATGRQISIEYSADPLYQDPGTIIGVVLSFRRLDGPENGLKTGQQPRSPLVPPNFQMLFETLPEGVFTVDCDWRITSFNQTAEKMTGFSKDQAIGNRCWEIFRSELCRKDCPMATSLKTGKTCLDQEIVVEDHKGEKLVLMANVSVIHDGNGEVIGAVETFRPVDPQYVFGSPVSAPLHAFKEIIGKSPAMREIFAMLPDLAASEANVLISGESGTGKELLAEAIHRLSPRRQGPFVPVNCAAFAETLLESELFGHEKGAFTGADRAKPGRFELATGGTLFLDEIGELKPHLQVKLLRVLDQGVFERVGGTRSIKLAARIVSATNQDLAKARVEGRFREDLYYRLKTVPIVLPPLRERAEDIPSLVAHFIRRFNSKYQKGVRSVDPKVLRKLMDYSWPGNIRELERCIEHAFVFVKGPVIFARYLPNLEEMLIGKPQPPTPPASPTTVAGIKRPIDKAAMIAALEQSGGKRQEAAQRLGISRTSMWRRMKELGLI